MALPETCAVCGLLGPGRLDPYPEVARACGWTHNYAHLDCARYRLRTEASDDQGDLFGGDAA